jgi:hypothetical protein
MATRLLRGSVFTNPRVDPTSLRVRVRHPGAQDTEAPLGADGRFSLPLEFLKEGRVPAPGLPGLQKKLAELGLDRFLREQGVDPVNSSEAKALVALILAEDPALLGLEVPGQLEILDSNDAVVGRRSFFYDVTGVDEPVWFALNANEAPLTQPGAGTSASAAPDWNAELGEILRSCAVPSYGPNTPRQEEVPLLRAALMLMSKEGWSGVFQRSSAARTKTIHQFGVVGHVEFKPHTHPFGGLFSQKAGACIRMTFGVNDPAIIIPGVALTFPVTNEKSLNLVALSAAQGQGANPDFFALKMRTSAEPIPSWKSGTSWKERLFFFGLKELEEKVSKAIVGGSLRRLPLDRMFHLTQDGVTSNGAVPAFLELRPTPAVKAEYDKSSTAGLAKLATIPLGTELFTVHAMEEDSKEQVIKIHDLGTLTLKSALIESPYGDRQLHVHHDYPLKT